MESNPRVVVKAGLAIACFLLAACDGFFEDPAPARNGHLAIRFSLSSTDNGAVFDKVQQIEVIGFYDVALADSNDFKETEPDFRMKQAFAPSAETRIQVPLNVPGGTHTLVFAAALQLADGSELFFGFGETTIESGKTTVAHLLLIPELDHIDVPASVRTLTAIGDTITIVATGRFATGDLLPGVPLDWFSLDPLIATVNQNGLVRAVRDGNVVIRVRSPDNRTAVVNIQVTVIVTSVTVSNPLDTLSVGATRAFIAVARDRFGNPITGRPFTWSSSTPSIATVNGAGFVTGVAPGQATIFAQTAGGIQGSAVVTVRPGLCVAQPISIGQTVTGTFDANSCRIGTNRGVRYMLNLVAEAEFTISRGDANSFVSFVFDSRGFGFGVGSGGSFPYHLPAGQYPVEINTFSPTATGAYSLTLAAGNSLSCIMAILGTGTVTVTRTISQPHCPYRATGTLEVDPTRSIDQYRRPLLAGQSVTVTANSATPVHIEIRAETTGEPIVARSAFGTLVSVQFTSPTQTFYVINVIGAQGDFGNYTVTIQ